MLVVVDLMFGLDDVHAAWAGLGRGVGVYGIGAASGTPGPATVCLSEVEFQSLVRYSTQLPKLVRTPSIDVILLRDSCRVTTTRRDLLDRHVLKEGHLDRQTLPQVVPMPQLSLLATSPRIQLTLLRKRQGVTLSTPH